MEYCYRCMCDREFIFEGQDKICKICGYEYETAKKWHRDNGEGTKNWKKTRKTIFGVELYSEYFTYMNKKYEYDNIKEIEMNVTDIRHSLNFFPSGKSVDTNLIFKFYKGKNLIFKNVGLKELTGRYVKSPEQDYMINMYKQILKMCTNLENCK